MSYYVSVVNGSCTVLALGPFNTHGDALARVDEVRDYVQAHDRDGHWYAYGTAHDRTKRVPGKLNTALHL